MKSNKSQHTHFLYYIFIIIIICSLVFHIVIIVIVITSCDNLKQIKQYCLFLLNCPVSSQHKPWLLLTVSWPFSTSLEVNPSDPRGGGGPGQHNNLHQHCSPITGLCTRAPQILCDDHMLCTNFRINYFLSPNKFDVMVFHGSHETATSHEVKQNSSFPSHGAGKISFFSPISFKISVKSHGMGITCTYILFV